MAKDTGVLMRVIKTLSSSASTDHRDREKAKLEKDFRKSDLQLDHLLAQHQASLNAVLSVSILEN
jgi:exocyst complex component 4